MSVSFRFTRRISGSAAGLLVLLLTACGNSDGAGAPAGGGGDETVETGSSGAQSSPDEAQEGSGEEPTLPDAREPALEIAYDHLYTVRIADAFYDPNAPEAARSSGQHPAPAGHTYLHLLVVVEGSDEIREYPAPPHGMWNIEYPGCEEHQSHDTPDSCTQGFPNPQGTDYFTREEQAAGATLGLGRYDVLEPGEVYYKSAWWTVAEDELPADPELCEAQRDRTKIGESTGNCIPVGVIR